MKFKSLRTLILSLAVCLSVTSPLAYMTDQQVIDYAKTAAAQGKSKQTIGRELLAKGVTEAQIKRIQSSLQDNGNSGAGGDGTDFGTPRRKTKTTAPANGNKTRQTNLRSSRGESQMSPVTTVNSKGIYSTNTFQETVIEDNVELDNMRSYVDPEGKNVFGRNIFTSRNLTFEPNENLATPDDYKLGPGDEVVITIWGNNEDHIRQTISPEGRIFVSQIGPIYLNGLSISRANKLVKEMFASKYADVAGDGSDISLTLGNLRTIQVDVMGEVETPGTYRISPFSTLFHALYNAGGTTENGSLRAIEVIRNGKKIASSDIYDYLFNGKRSNDIRLREGDVIVVPAYERLVDVEGEVKRPGIYELKSDETLDDLLKYSGGTKATAFSDRVAIDRVVNGAKTVAVVDANEFASTKLDDGDIVHVGKAIDRYDNRVEIGGAVFRPGYYAINGEVRTLKDLINIANGVKEDAFLNRALLYRETPDMNITVLPVDLGEILNGSAPDIQLQRNDVLVVASKNEIEEKGDITIAGEVNFPGAYKFAENMTVEDLILQAGGLKDGASISTVDVSRRINDQTSKTKGETLSQNFRLTIKDGLIVDGQPDFVLMPYDVIDIRRSPSYIPQKRVTIKGEVPFEGSYTLTQRSERLSDLVKRAGGVSQYAYLRGASLSRQMTDAEIAARDELIRLTRNSADKDSISSEKILMTSTYKVGINLDLALENPGGSEDLVLQEGDELYVPQLVNTVKISGDVLFPNTVIFAPGKKLKYYVEQAGGFGNTANKGRAFVIYMNGHVAKGKGAKIEPGCHIIVPSKQKGKGLSVAEWLAIGTTAASLGTMGATISNLIK